MMLESPAGHSERSGWDGIPAELLGGVLEVLSKENSLENMSALRSTCVAWRTALDAHVLELQPRAWPVTPGRAGILLSSLFPSIRALDLSNLPLADGGCGTSANDYAQPGGVICSPCSGASSADPCSVRDNAQRPSSAGSLDLSGAITLQSRLDAIGDLDCVVAVRAGGVSRSAMTAYVAARWPECAPAFTPSTAARIWRELPALQGLQELAISGAMLDVQSVRTLVDPSPDEAAAAGIAAAAAAAAGDEQQAVTITHIYSLALPAAVCQLTHLRSLAVQWRIPAGDSSSSTSSQAAAAAGLHGGLVLTNRRRSYEGSPAPDVLLLADSHLRLPQQFSRLCNLQQLELAASFSGSNALASLLSMSCLQGLTLGPGELDMQALQPLAAAGVLRQLQRLVLRQAGVWDARALAGVLAACKGLQHWEVQELELGSRLANEAAIPPEARLTSADTAAVAASLTSLCWSTCSQRLGTGSSMLARMPAASPRSADAAGAWLGSCTALRTLRICGEQQAAAAVLSAPALDALSAAICQCSSLQQLEVHGLGVPMLPAGLSQLQHLQTVSIASTSMARRVLQSPDAALAPLAGCSRLQSLTLVGCELRSLPIWLLNLTQLTALHMSGNYIQELQNAASCFGLPAGLQLLNLSDNRLRAVPGSIAGLQQLSVLQLNANYLSNLPRQIWALPALQELSVRENMLAKLPECGGGRSSISSSTATSSSKAGSAANGVQQPPPVAAAAAAAAAAGVDDIDESDLGGMGVLLLCSPAASNGSSNWDTSRCASSSSYSGNSRSNSSTASTTSTSSSASISSLRTLVLAENQLAQLPASITALSCLQHLDLGHNQLQGLPETGSLWGLTRLTSLHLGHNHLKKIPAGITRLQQLVSLDVSGNHLPGLGSSSSSNNKAQAVLGSKPAVAAPTVAAPAAVEASAAAGCAAAAGSSAAAAAASPPCLATAGSASSSAPAGAPTRNNSPTGKLSNEAGRRSSRSGSGSSLRDALPSPLLHLKQLKQLRMGGQQVDNRRSSSCPLAMLLGGLSDLVELLRSLAPPGHQCPVTKAAAAAVAHLTRVGGGKRAKRERERQLLERVQTEPGWVVLPAPKAAAGLAAGAAAVAGGGAAMAVY